MIINEEIVAERIEALESFINSFPNSPFVPAMRNELSFLRNNSREENTSVR